MSVEDDLDLFGAAHLAEDDVFRLTARRGERSGRATSGPLGGRLTRLLSGRRIGGGRASPRAAPTAFAGDARQRVIVT